MSFRVSLTFAPIETNFYGLCLKIRPTTHSLQSTTTFHISCEKLIFSVLWYFYFSSITTSISALLAYIPQVSPPGPPPIIIISYILSIFSPKIPNGTKSHNQISFLFLILKSYGFRKFTKDET